MKTLIQALGLKTHGSKCGQEAQNPNNTDTPINMEGEQKE